MNFQISDTNKKYLITGIIFFIGFALTFYNFYKFQTVSIPQMKNEVLVEENKIQDKQNELKKLKEFSEDLEKIKTELGQLNLTYEAEKESIPYDFNVGDLLRKLHLISDNAGIEFDTFKPGAIQKMEHNVAKQNPNPQAIANATLNTPSTNISKKENNISNNNNNIPAYSIHDFTIRLRGDFSELLSFLEQIFRIKRIIQLGSLKLQPQNSTDSIYQLNSRSVNLDIEAVFYTFKLN